MKSVVIYFSAITNFKSNLSQLDYPDIRNILFINTSTLEQLTENQQLFFEKIHIIDPMTFDTTLPFVKQYLREVKKENIALVTNDECCIPIVSQLTDYFELQGDGETSILRFIDKIVMKDTLNAQGVRTPYHQLFDKEKYFKDKQQYIQDIENKFKYPFVLKPVSLYGSVGFNKLDSRADWFNHAEQAARTDAIFQIEEFIAGTLFHCDAIVKNSQIIFNSISEYIWPIALFKQGYPTGSIWLPPFDLRWNKLNEFHERVIRAMQPPDGATHCELFLSENNEIIFLEIAARPSGALVVSMVEQITGVNLEVAHFKLRLHRPLTIQQKPLTTFSLFCYIPKIHGQVLSLESPSLKSELNVEWTIKPGDVITAASMEENDILLRHSNIAATIILNNPDFDSLYDDFLTLKTAKLIKTIRFLHK